MEVLNIIPFITHLRLYLHFLIRKQLNNFPYFTSGYFFDQLRMRGMFSNAGVHNLAHGNRPEFVAMAVKQPEVR